MLHNFKSKPGPHGNSIWSRITHKVTDISKLVIFMVGNFGIMPL